MRLVSRGQFVPDPRPDAYLLGRFLPGLPQGSLDLSPVDRQAFDVCRCDRSAHNREIARQVQCPLSCGSTSSETMRHFCFLSATRLGRELVPEHWLTTL